MPGFYKQILKRNINDCYCNFLCFHPQNVLNLLSLFTSFSLLFLQSSCLKVWQFKIY